MAFCLQAQSDTTTQDASVGPMQFPEIGLPIQFHHIRAMVCGLDSDSFFQFDVSQHVLLGLPS